MKKSNITGAVYNSVLPYVGQYKGMTQDEAMAYALETASYCGGGLLAIAETSASAVGGNVFFGKARERREKAIDDGLKRAFATVGVL